MKLEQQVCTLEQAKRLKELGVIAKTSFYWDLNTGGPFLTTVVGRSKFEVNEIISECVPAFTLAELGSLLPYTVGYGYVDAELSLRKDYSEWSARYEHEYNTEGGYGAAVREVWNDLEYSSENAAQALATLLIHVLEKDLTTASDCNARLLQ